jgi:DNA processing protein
MYTPLHDIALSLVPQIGPTIARVLLQELGSAEAIFKCKKSHLQAIEGIGPTRATQIAQFKEWAKVEREIKFCEQHNIHILHTQHHHYPTRLLECIDAPTILYFKGNTTLNNTKVISVVGRRQCSEYGKKIVENLINDLAAYQVLIISGLAMGIDAQAHRMALKHGLPTVGVLAHGLDTLYPALHKSLAKDMIQQGGGLLTEFMQGSAPDKENFPTRNRIVAGMADATIVVETDIKGGSMITAQLANGYNKEVMAYPGEVYSANSAGCNHLIKTLKANLITSASDVIQLLNWDTQSQGRKPQQRQLFIQLTADEQAIINCLQQQANLSIDELLAQVPIKPAQLAAALLSLELQDVIKVMPGKMYGMR